MTDPPPIDADDRVALVGIGSALRGDDGVGPALVRAIEDRIAHRAETADIDRLQCVDAGVAPENYAGPIRAFGPDWIVLVDAVAFDAPPGTGQWVDSADLGGESFSSHKSTPAMLQTFLAEETEADVALFGVVPETLAFGADRSEAVEAAMDDLAQQLLDALAVETAENRSD